jgi:hypothetical protein
MEEFSWLMRSYEDLDFNALGSLSSELAILTRGSSQRLGRHKTSKLTSSLVGSLPDFLVDEVLFPTNEDIAEFSVVVLNINIPRWQKKSKYELIGHIVCNVNEATPSQTSRLIEDLDQILDERGDTKHIIGKERKSGRGWNEVIQEITRI